MFNISHDVSRLGRASTQTPSSSSAGSSPCCLIRAIVIDSVEGRRARRRAWLRPLRFTPLVDAADRPPLPAPAHAVGASSSALTTTASRSSSRSFYTFPRRRDLPRPTATDFMLRNNCWSPPVFARDRPRGWPHFSLSAAPAAQWTRERVRVSQSRAGPARAPAGADSHCSSLRCTLQVAGPRDGPDPRRSAAGAPVDFGAPR